MIPTAPGTLVANTTDTTVTYTRSQLAGMYISGTSYYDLKSTGTGTYLPYATYSGGVKTISWEVDGETVVIDGMTTLTIEMSGTKYTPPSGNLL